MGFELSLKFEFPEDGESAQETWKNKRTNRKITNTETFEASTELKPFTKSSLKKVIHILSASAFSLKKKHVLTDEAYTDPVRER